MNHILQNFEKILEKFKFMNRIPEDIQEFAISSSKENLISILKTAGDYNFIFGKILSVYYLGKRLGTRITFMQSKIILFSITFILSASISVASYIAYKFISQVLTDKQINSIILEPEKSISVPKVIQSAMPKVIQSGNANNANKTTKADRPIGIQPFSGNDIELTDNINSIFVDKLKNKIGSNKIIIINGINKKGISKIIIGSVRTLGSSIYITAKIINTENSRVEFAASERFSNKEDIDEACSSISSKIIERIK